MLLIETAIFYLLFGACVALAVYLRRESQSTLAIAFQSLAACTFWPLYLPLLLAAAPAPATVTPTGGVPEVAAPPDDPLATAIVQVEFELDTALHSLDGWASDALASDQYRLEELRSAWRLQAQRIRELDRLLAGPGARMDSLGSATTANERVRQSEQTRQENLRRLERLRDQMSAELLGTLAWVRELVTRIHLARYTGAPPSSAEELVTQIAAAVEGLSEVSAWREEAGTTG